MADHRSPRVLSRVYVATDPSDATPRVDAGSPAGWYWTLVVAVCFFFTSNPLVFFGFDISLQIVVAVTLLTAAFTRYRPGLPNITWALLVVLTFVAFIWLSWLWSINPGKTALGALQHSIITGVALVIGVRVTAAVLWLGVTLGATAVVGVSALVAVINLPGARVHPSYQALLAGIGTNPNILAYTCVLGIAVTLAIVPATPWGRVLWVTALAVIAGGITISGSRTGIGAGIALLGLAGVLAIVGKLRDRQRTVITVLIEISLIALTVLSVILPVAVKLLGKASSISFSGRLPIWEAAIAVSKNAPLGGFGWSAIWPHPWEIGFGPEDTTAVLQRIQDLSQIPATHGHSSMFDLLPQVGLLGLTLVCLILILTVSGGSDSLRSAEGRVAHEGRLIILGIAALLLSGLTEPLTTLPIGWFVLVALACLPGQRGLPTRLNFRRPLNPNRTV